MSNLLHKPKSKNGKTHNITIYKANWNYVEFGLYKLLAGESATEKTNTNEDILVCLLHTSDATDDRTR